MNDVIEVAFDPRAPRTTLDAVEDRFIAHDGPYADMPGVAICHRYALVRGVLRDRLRGMHLYDDLTPIFEEAERTYAGTMLFAAYDLAALQGWFFWMMKLNGICRRPAAEWHAAYADYWKRRLADRQRDTLPWRLTEEGQPTALLGPYLPPVTIHPWRLN